MNLVRRAAVQQQVGAGLSLSDFDRVLDAMYGGQPSYTGKPVSQTTALAVSAVWACVAALADDIATLPLLTYRREGKGRQRAPDHYLWDLFMLQPNPEISAWRFFQLMQAWLLLWGNAYAEIEISGRGQVTALWPWRPDRTRVSRAYQGGPLQYQYRLYNGNLTTPVPRERMFHLRGLGTDGVLGLSPIEVHKQTIGLSLGIVEHGARFFSNGAAPGGVLQTDKEVGDKAYKQLQEDWATQHEGLTNAHRIAILEQGLKWQAIGSGSMVDAAYIDSLNLTFEDVARMYKMPQHRIGLMKSATNANVEEMALEYVTYTLAPWAANWQNQIHCDLLSARENKQVYTAFDYRNLLRGNHEAMSKWISALTDRGILSADEVREDMLDMNPQPDGIGEIYWRAVNMGPVGEQSAQGMNSTDSPANAQQVKPIQKKNTNGTAALHGMDLSDEALAKVGAMISARMADTRAIVLS